MGNTNYNITDCETMQQHTLAGEITQTGVGLHSGVKTQVRILPAPAGSGRFFLRVDLPG